MSGDRACVDVAGEVQHETDVSYKFCDGAVTIWLPKSQCEWDQDAKTMSVPEWLAMREGLI